MTQQDHIELNVKGMTCANCALGIRQYLEKEGLEEVSVSFSAEEVSFDLVEGKNVKKIIKGIEQLGFEVVKEDAEESEGLGKVEKLFLFCLPFTLPLILAMFLPFEWLHNSWVQLGLALPVYLVGMYHFGNSGLRSLKNGVPNMDVLIALGATAAFGYSLYGSIMQLGHDFLFYETAASIISIVLLGNVMEYRSVKRTSSAIRELIQLQKTTAKRIISQNGQEQIETINAKELQENDLLLVNSGDRIPMDGIMIEGEAEVDESMMTGESLPLEKNTEDQLIGGSLLVSGSLKMKVTAVGKQTVLSQMIDLVKKAQAHQPSIQKLADKISAIFVPAVIGIALLTFSLSYFAFDLSLKLAIIHSVAVLVIACPCAMGLATPTAVMVGIGRASKNGILIKGGDTLETFSQIERVVFDKTGTLTTGKFQLKAIHAETGEIPEIQSVVLGMEQHSSHPIAQSLNKALEGIQAAQLQEVTETKGVGMYAEDAAANSYQIGAYQIAAHLTKDASHQLYLLKNDTLWATLDIEDEIRADAKEVIQFFNENGIETVMLSGDRQERCDAVAAELGIKNVIAEQMPDEKLAKIEALTNEKPTAMVGDGINDAAALTRASIGISLGGATAIAMQSAQVILLKNEIGALKDLWQIGKHTVLTIKQNLFWAFFYNVLAIPAAALGFLSPMIAAFTMAFSDVIVIGNSLRLKAKKINA